jgi:UDP-glucose 4-epimerase
MTLDRIVVLGHSGYIGSRLAEAFRAQKPALSVIGRSVGEVDLTDPRAAGSLAADLTPSTALVICAAIKKQLGDNTETFAKNMAMVTNLCGLIAASSVPRILFFSSASVYGEDVPRDIITEATPVEPTSYYGIGKFTAERMLRKVVAAKSGCTMSIVRPALVYGPHEPGVYYGPSGFFKAAIAGDPITLWGDGEELREFIYIDDIVELARRLTLSDENGVLNIVSGTSYRFVDALTIVRELAGRDVVVNARPRSKDKVDAVFDNAALRRAVPGFRFTTLAEGLAKTAQAQGVRV